MADRFAGGCFAALGACLLGAPACSGATGYDFRPDAAPVHETIAPEDASLPPPDATWPADDAAPRIHDSGPLRDGRAAIEASAPVDSGGSSDAGDDGGTFALCARLCMGCCDATGKCRPGNTLTVCGVKAAVCEDCSTHKCSTLTEAPCCGTSGCGCAVAGVLGCK